MVLPRKNHPPLWGYPPSRRGFLWLRGSFFTSHQSSIGADKVVHPGDERIRISNISHGLRRNIEKLWWVEKLKSGIWLPRVLLQLLKATFKMFRSLWGGSTTLPYVARFAELNDLKWSPPVPEHGIEKNQWMKPCKGLPSWCHGAVVADGIG